MVTHCRSHCRSQWNINKLASLEMSISERVHHLMYQAIFSIMNDTCWEHCNCFICTFEKLTQFITHSIQWIECVPLHSIGAEFVSNSIAMTVRRIVCVLDVSTHRRIVSAIVVTQPHLSVGRTLWVGVCACVSVCLFRRNKTFLMPSSTWIQHTYFFAGCCKLIGG